MKLLDVTKDDRYLYIITDEGTRQQSLSWRGVEALERKCRSLINQDITYSTAGSWDSNVWFQDINAISITARKTETSNSSQFPLKKNWPTRSIRKIYGPPGTGKTTRLVEIATTAIKNGINPEDVGYFAFTNVAADEAKERISASLNIEQSRFGNFSTLHSLATRMGGNEGKELCQKEHLQLFDKNISTREEWLRAGDASSIVVRPIHPVLSEYSIMLNRKDKTPKFTDQSYDKAESLLSQYYGPIVNRDNVLAYAEKYYIEYEKFKKDKNLADFNDVVSCVAKDSFPVEKIPTFELLIVDEAQDLSALQWDLVTKLSKHARQTILAGDDDQAIMESFGAAPELFNNFQTTEPDEVLPISYRLPKNIKNFIDKLFPPKWGTWAGRKEKIWTENPNARHEGEVINSTKRDANSSSPSQNVHMEPLSLDKLLRIVEQSKEQEWLIMAPTRATCGKISTCLEALMIPHFCHRKDVLSTKNKILVQTIHTSKGMGSDNVAVVSLTRGDMKMLEEDSRLKYVAYTRSKKNLYLVKK